MNDEIKVAFSVICTKSKDNRFKVGETYSLYYKVRGEKRIELSYLSHKSSEEYEFKSTSRMFTKELLTDINLFYKRWYDDCVWTNYDFKLIHNAYSVDLI